MCIPVLSGPDRANRRKVEDAISSWLLGDDNEGPGDCGHRRLCCDSHGGCALTVTGGCSVTVARALGVAVTVTGAGAVTVTDAGVTAG
jgi:hypothetical protein